MKTMNNTLFSAFFAFVFAATVALAGCSAGTLTGPEAEEHNSDPQTVVIDSNVEAPHNDSEDTNGDAGEPHADHNEVND